MKPEDHSPLADVEAPKPVAVQNQGNLTPDEFSPKRSSKKLFPRRGKKLLLILLPILLIIGLIGGLGYVVYTESAINIYEVEVANITSGSATVVFRTDEVIQAKVWISESKSINPLTGLFAKTFYDDRDVEENDDAEFILKSEGRQERKLHTITVRELEPDKEYYVWVGEQFLPRSVTLLSSNKQSFATFPVIDELYTPEPVYSTVVDSNNKPLENILVFAYLYKENVTLGEEDISSPMVTTTNDDGGWSFDLNSFRNQEGKRYPVSAVDTRIRIITENEDELTFSNPFFLDEYSPLPMIKFSAVYQPPPINNEIIVPEVESALDQKLILPAKASLGVGNNVNPAPTERHAVPSAPGSFSLTSGETCQGTCRVLYTPQQGPYETRAFPNGYSNCCGYYVEVQYTCSHGQWIENPNNPACYFQNAEQPDNTCYGTLRPLNSTGPYTTGEFPSGHAGCGQDNLKYYCYNGNWSISSTAECQPVQQITTCYGTCRNPFTNLVETKNFPQGFNQCCGTQQGDLETQYTCLGNNQWSHLTNPILCAQQISPQRFTANIRWSTNQISSSDYLYLSQNGITIKMRFTYSGGGVRILSYQNALWSQEFTESFRNTNVKWEVLVNGQLAQPDDGDAVICDNHQGFTILGDNQYISPNCRVEVPQTTSTTSVQSSRDVTYTWDTFDEADAEYLDDSNINLVYRFTFRGLSMFVPYQDGEVTQNFPEDAFNNEYVTMELFMNGKLADFEIQDYYGVHCRFFETDILIARELIEMESQCRIVEEVSTTTTTTTLENVNLRANWSPLNTSNNQTVLDRGVNLTLRFTWENQFHEVSYQKGNTEISFQRRDGMDSDTVTWEVRANGQHLLDSSVQSLYGIRCTTYQGTFSIHTVGEIIPECTVTTTSEQGSKEITLSWNTFSYNDQIEFEEVGYSIEIKFDLGGYIHTVAYDEGQVVLNIPDYLPSFGWHVSVHGADMSQQVNRDNYFYLQCDAYSDTIFSIFDQELSISCYFGVPDPGGRFLSIKIPLQVDTHVDDQSEVYVFINSQNFSSYSEFSLKDIVEGQIITQRIYEGPITIRWTIVEDKYHCSKKTAWYSFSLAALYNYKFKLDTSYFEGGPITCVYDETQDGDDDGIDIGVPPDNVETEPITQKVLPIVYYGGHNPTADYNYMPQIFQMRDNLNTASISRKNQFVNASIDLLDPIVLAGPPPQNASNCEQYLPEIHAGNWSTSRADETGCWGSFTADYGKILHDNDVCSKVLAGTVDEVWLMSFAWGGFLEVAMTEGIGSYSLSVSGIGGGRLYDAPCSKAYFVMGTQYETQSEGDGMHIFHHRFEAVLKHFIEKEYLLFDTNDDRYDWAYGAEFPINPVTSCGNAHWPPNAVQHYDYGNQGITSSDCYTWDPHIHHGAAVRSNINCAQWDCRMVGFHIWWMQNIPGANNTLKTLNGGPMPNWWRLFLKGADRYNTPITSTDSFLKNDLIPAIYSEEAIPEILTTGLYEMTIPNLNKTYSVQVEGETVLRFFEDRNVDGEKQDDEEYITNFEGIQISKIADIFDFDFDVGWNLISLPFFDESLNSASELIKRLGENGINISSVATFTDGSWHVYSERDGADGKQYLFSEDFQLIPGEGYFVFTDTNGTIKITGNAFESAVPVELHNGWNLVGVQSPGTDYTAESFLNFCIGEELMCDTVSRYDGGIYDNVVKQDGLLYGNDFNLVNKRGYFIRVKSGGGKVISP